MGRAMMLLATERGFGEVVAVTMRNRDNVLNMSNLFPKRNMCSAYVILSTTSIPWFNELEI